MALTPNAGWGAWVPTLLMFVPIMLVVAMLAGPMPDKMNMTAVVMLTSIGMGIGIYVNWGVRAILRGLGIIRPGCDRLCKVVASLADEDRCRAPRRRAGCDSRWRMRSRLCWSEESQ